MLECEFGLYKMPVKPHLFRNSLKIILLYKIIFTCCIRAAKVIIFLKKVHSNKNKSLLEKIAGYFSSSKNLRYSKCSFNTRWISNWTGLSLPKEKAPRCGIERLYVFLIEIKEDLLADFIHDSLKGIRVVGSQISQHFSI